jgi:hypothetical protein
MVLEAGSDPLGAGPPPGAGNRAKSTLLGGFPAGAAPAITVGLDYGRGRGRPGGGMQNRGTSLQPVPWGSNPAGGYDESDVFKILAGLPPEAVARIQRKMASAGIIKPGQVLSGRMDRTTQQAFAEVLGIANTRAQTWETALDTLKSGGEESLAEARADKLRQQQQLTELSFGTQLNQYQRSDPASVRQTLEAAFREALGRKPKPDETDRFVNSYLSAEESAQRTVFNARDRLELEQRDRVRAGDALEAEAATAEATGGGGGGGAEGGSEADQLWANLQRLIADAPGRVTPGKRTRSYEEQVRLYERYKAGKGPLAAKPGTSKHSDGRANDLKYENQATKRWVLQNAHRYGLHFPLLKAGEDWHIELIGGGKGNGHSHAPMGGRAAPVSTDVVSQQVDASARAVEFARNNNPVETRAFDIGGQFNALLGILQRGVGVG